MGFTVGAGASMDLRERVAALADEWEARLHRNPPTTAEAAAFERAVRYAAQELRAALGEHNIGARQPCCPDVVKRPDWHAHAAEWLERCADEDEAAGKPSVVTSTLRDVADDLRGGGAPVCACPRNSQGELISLNKECPADPSRPKP